MLLGIAFKTLFTTVERFLIKNQRKFVLNFDEIDEESDSSDNDYDDTNLKESIANSKFFNLLLKGTQPKLDGSLAIELDQSLTIGTGLGAIENYTPKPLNQDKMIRSVSI